MDNHQFRVTVITVVKDALPDLEITQRSLESQTNCDFEWIIIDGASQDGTIIKFQELHDPRRIFLSEPDQGLYYAMNKGLRIAQGEFIGILNAGDTYCNDTIQKVINGIRENPRADILYGSVTIDSGMPFLIDHSDLKARMILHPGSFVQRTVYRDVGFLNTSYSVAADYEFMCRAQSKGYTFQKLDGTLANFVSGGYSSQHVIKSILETFWVQIHYFPRTFWPNLFRALKSTAAHFFKLIGKTA